MPQPTSEPLSWRALDLSDLAAVEQLHRRAIGTAGPDVVKPEPADFFAGILGGRGRILGAFSGGRLVAYGVLQHELPDDDDPRPILGIAPDVQRVKLAGASVAEDFRGIGLQRALIAARVKLGREAFAAPLLYATSAPRNVASWSNLLAEGFMIRAIKLYYGGFPRYVLVNEERPAPWDAQALLDPRDVDAQTRMLAQGWRGVGSERTAEGMAIRYAHCAAGFER